MSEFDREWKYATNTEPDEGLFSKLISHLFVFLVIGLTLAIASPFIYVVCMTYLIGATLATQAGSRSGFVLGALVAVLFALAPLLLVGLITRAIVRRQRRRTL